LTKEQTVDVRDRATFVMLSRASAAEIEKKRGYADVDPDRVWEEWQDRRRKQSDERVSPP
jgi:hypothetical protein